MIHPGPVLGPVKTKIDLTHWPLEICAILKSAGEMDHGWPPKENATSTDVEHAMETVIFLVNTVTPVLRQENWQRMVEIIALVIASTRSGVGNLSIYGSDLSNRSADKRCSRVGRSVRRLARRKCYRVEIHSNVPDGEGPIGAEVRGNILI